MAYASVCEAELLGDKNRLLFNILDVCLCPEATQEQRRGIVISLLEKAQATQASSVQIYCTPALYQAVEQSGGVPVKQWFHWPLLNGG